MEQKNSLLKSSLIYALYMALIGILISVIVWAGSLMENMGIFGTAAIGIIQFVIMFVLLIVFSKNYRNKELGGYISFAEAFKFGILVIIFSTIVTTIYNYIFHTIIDPNYMENLMAVLQEKTLTMLENMGAPEAQINQTMQQFEVPTIAQTIKQSLLYGIIGGAILALVSSAIVKKKEETAE